MNMVSTFALSLVFITFYVSNIFGFDKKNFTYTSDPIDVVIPCAEKDKDTLNLCIMGIKKYGKNIRRVIVISRSKLTEKAEWFNENNFPITKDMVTFELFKNEQLINAYKTHPKNRLGWIYQQILKLYAPLVIENISPNVLLLDSDTIFLKPVTFIAPQGVGYFNPGTEYHLPYFDHMGRLLPGLKKVFPTLSGISHHMLVQKCVLEDLKNTVEAYHKKPMWQALLFCIDPQQLYNSSMSEYEIYFNYSALRNNQFQIRKLKWANVSSPKNLAQYRQEGYDYISAHEYLRTQESSFKNSDNP